MRNRYMIKIIIIIMLLLITISYSSSKKSSDNSLYELAPDFEAINDNGEGIRLKNYLGNYIILYFFPRAFTPG